MSTAKTTVGMLEHSQLTLRNANQELVSIVLASVADWMNSNRGRTEYDYFPPYSKFIEHLDKMEGSYTAYIRFFNFKEETEYLGIYHRDPKAHLTLINADPNEQWILRGDLIFSVYTPKPIFVGEIGGKHASEFDGSEICDTLKKLLMLSWD